MTITPAQFAAKCNRAATDLKNLENAAARAAALAAKSTAVGELRRVVGPSQRLSGVGRRGAKLGVKAQQLQSGAWMAAATGPWQLIESDTKPHRIPKERRRGRRRVVVIPGVGVRAYAKHPGTRGRHPWAKTLPQVRQQAPLVVGSEMSRVLGKVFDGR